MGDFSKEFAGFCNYFLAVEATGLVFIRAQEVRLVGHYAARRPDPDLVLDQTVRRARIHPAQGPVRPDPGRVQDHLAFGTAAVASGLARS
jgi:hypothetical protein